MAADKPGLAKQDLATLDVSTLNPLSPEVISRQATINIGTIGHVAHGKSTVVKSISGTVRFKNELERNITIKLGYANAKIYQCVDPECPRPVSYLPISPHISALEAPPRPSRRGRPARCSAVRHVSFVDCPGHDILMATMLNGGRRARAAVMDAALLLIAGNEPCPQPQTSEHLAAVEIMKLEHIIILQNKIDLVKEASDLPDISPHLPTPPHTSPHLPTPPHTSPHLPTPPHTSPHLPTPPHTSPHLPTPPHTSPHLPTSPHTSPHPASYLPPPLPHLPPTSQVGQEIEIRPGIISRASGGVRCYAVPAARYFFSRTRCLLLLGNDLQYAVPGGLIGVGTLIDPTLTRADRLVGQVRGSGNLGQSRVSYYLLRRLLGVKTADGEKQGKVQKLAKGEILMLNIGSTSTGGRIQAGAVRADLAKILLTAPVCTSEKEKIALSRRIDKHWRLIGWGEINRGVTLEPTKA
ncbi:hypothetical protein EMIHUDRAFT_62317 [Emiliania huxleyi CCMP1516]|uniref:protein-synthesizing GTPase n=2 Tax=Emiliania huxleyi TaxID=2903 RepID=A0A0D3I2K5_EMIH1|nr:hypothetical protein EMIHUDRAFT_62317 [Emiliania huxleyi CCMP1516]EOD05490.1 hypothetical protein EMIHUDRAFT_62317 [Emiliania huxleyi CCMP1516]|eukprot:XP_005757919.1 hypothetical protein EMIHUDRAFT_62317 [Emiliania huxleyi CCMP1516]